MRRIYAAEARASAPAWIAVSLTFIGITFALALALLVVDTGTAALETGFLDESQAGTISTMGWLNLVLCSLVGLSVVGSSTSLVVNSRRGAVARLALAGATPRQVVSTIMWQLTAVSVACSVVGALLALPALAPVVTFVANTRDGGVPVPPMVYSPSSLTTAVAFTLVISLVGGWRQARGASRIPPVEALRAATLGAEQRGGRLRWASFVLWAGLLVAAFASLRALVDFSGAKEAFTNVFLGTMIVLIVTGLALAAASPITVGRLTRAWTAVIPAAVSPTWHLARNTVLAKSERLTKSVTPAMFTIGLLFGIQTLGVTLIASMKAAGDTRVLENTGVDTLIHFMGLPLTLSLLASVGSLVMMGRQRDAELALAGVGGATPAQQRALPVLEGLIVSVTATILAAVMVGLALLYGALGVALTPWPFAVTIPWEVAGVTAVVVAGVTIAATALPTLPALRLPAPRVIARLVAD